MANDLSAYYRPIGLYLEGKLAEKPDWIDAISNSGIFTLDARLRAAFQKNGGKVQEIPFWKSVRLKAGLPYYVNNEKVEINGVKSKGFKFVLLERKLAYGITDNDVNITPDSISVEAHVSDEMVLNKQANNKDMLLATIKGIMSSTDMSGKILDITAKPITEDSKFLKTLAKASRQISGDMGSQFKIIMAHSSIVSRLVEENLASLTGITGAQGQTTALTNVLGYTLIEDDDVPFNSASATGSVYMFTSGAMFTTPIPVANEVEATRDASTDSNVLYNRWGRVIHPNGLDWIGATGATPTDEELATGTNWQVVYEPKNIPFAEIKVKLG